MENTIFDLQQSHENTAIVIRNAELELEVAAEIIENVKDVPYVGSLVKLGKTLVNYLDYRFIRKLGSFLKQSSDLPDETVAAFLDSLSQSDQKRISDYLTQLLYTAEEDEKCELMGLIYKSRALGIIDNEMMLRLCSIVNHAFLSDLNYLDNYLDESEDSTYVTDNLVALGLLSDSGNVYEESDNGVDSLGWGATKHKLNIVGLTLLNILKGQEVSGTK